MSIFREIGEQFNGKKDNAPEDLHMCIPTSCREDDETFFNDMFVQEMNEALIAFEYHSTPAEFSRLLGTFLRLIEMKADVIVPAEPEEVCGNFRIKSKFIEHADGAKDLVILTKPDDQYDYFAKRNIFSVLAEFEDENIRGLVINPEHDDILIYRDFIVNAANLFAAGIAYCDEQYERAMFWEITANRPMTNRDFENVEEAIHGLSENVEDSYLLLEFNDFIEDDEILFMQTKKFGMGYHIEIAYDMSDYGWDHPLILAADDVSEEMTVELFGRIGLEGEPSGDIHFVNNNFKDVGFGEE